MSEVFNEDCMIGMARYPDKYFDLALVDPQYGIGESFRVQSRGLKVKQKSGSYLFISSGKKHAIKKIGIQKDLIKHILKSLNE